MSDIRTSDRHDAPGNRPVRKILSVEDDEDYQRSLLFTLESVRGLPFDLQLLTASNEPEALKFIREHPDLALVLLDVVLERDDSGLRLVEGIRRHLENHQTRIVLLTGQPGFAPREDVMTNYEIDDYWCKSELTPERLSIVLKGNVRA